MKTSLWAVIAIVTGIVGFLVGYSVSGYTGTKTMAERSRGAHDAEARTPAAAPAAGATAAAPEKAEAGGYGASPAKPAAAQAGGSGAAAPEKPRPAKGPEAAKAAAAGY